MDAIAIVGILTFCLNGLVGSASKCDDGTEPKRWEVSILKGETDFALCDPQPSPSTLPCSSRFSRLDAVIEIKDGDKRLFQLRPDGSTQYDPGFTPDNYAKAFWLAAFSAYPLAARLWPTP